MDGIMKTVIKCQRLFDQEQHLIFLFYFFWIIIYQCIIFTKYFMYETIGVKSRGLIANFDFTPMGSYDYQN
jgi:hypothetical protein